MARSISRNMRSAFGVVGRESAGAQACEAGPLHATDGTSYAPPRRAEKGSEHSSGHLPPSAPLSRKRSKRRKHAPGVDRLPETFGPEGAAAYLGDGNAGGPFGPRTAMRSVLRAASLGKGHSSFKASSASPAPIDSQEPQSPTLQPADDKDSLSDGPTSSAFFSGKPLDLDILEDAPAAAAAPTVTRSPARSPPPAGLFCFREGVPQLSPTALQAARDSVDASQDPANMILGDAARGICPLPDGAPAVAPSYSFHAPPVTAESSGEPKRLLGARAAHRLNRRASWTNRASGSFVRRRVGSQHNTANRRSVDHATKRHASTTPGSPEAPTKGDGHQNQSSHSAPRRGRDGSWPRSRMNIFSSSKWAGVDDLASLFRRRGRFSSQSAWREY
jgi:hypothetical protein